MPSSEGLNDQQHADLRGPKHPETGDPYFLSTKTIPPEERLIFALDVPSVEEAKRAGRPPATTPSSSTRSASSCSATGGYFELIDWLVERGKKVFADLKLFDVPETVRSAVRRLRELADHPHHRPRRQRPPSWRPPAARRGISRSSPSPC